VTQYSRLATVGLLLATAAWSAAAPCDTEPCRGLPDHQSLRKALGQARAEDNGGLNLDMWGTVVNRDGVVCAVAFTGNSRGDQWPGSRAISAQKANTANAFSLPTLALSTANLYSAVQPGGSLFGLQQSNPVDPAVAYKGPAEAYGTDHDPLVGSKMGGVNVFGGGVALYDEAGRLLGAMGVSGDTSCADHNIAWKARHYLGLDHVPSGVSPTKDDNIVYDVGPNGRSAGGFGHPDCGGKEKAIGTDLPTTHPIRKSGSST
jgi:uncharacterized protein GlcG (DUF336 family)